MLARSRAAGFGRGDRLVVAFSGGRDSLALAAALRRARDVLGLSLLLVHVDHRMRAGSGDEAMRAGALAEELGLECQLLAVSAFPPDIHPHVGVEDAARRERYRLLFEVAEQVDARAVATGHHELDQAETVLLHLLRGGGVHGAAGMAEWRPPPVGQPTKSDISQEIGTLPDSLSNRWGQDGPWLWRPLLRESRRDIDEYATGLGRPWIEDPTNADLALKRNAVRHEILPLIEARFPGATAALARYAALAAADDEVLEYLVQAALEGHVDPGGRLPAALLDARHRGTQRRMVRRWLAAVTGSGEFTAERIDAVVDMALTGQGNRLVEIGGGWTIALRQGMLSARRQGDESEGES